MTRITWGVVALLSITASLSSAGCSKEKAVAKPKAPDMKPAVEALTNPTATLDKTQIAAVVKQVFNTHDLLTKVGIHRPVSRAMGAIKAGSSKKQSSQSVESDSPSLQIQEYPTEQAFGVNGGGWVMVTRICDGWGEQPSPNPENGTMVLNAGFTETGVDSVVWGKLRSCKYPVEIDEDTTYQIAINGGDNDLALSVYIGDAISFSGIDVQPFIAIIDADVTINNTTIPLKTSLRYDYKEKTLDFVLPVPTGTAVARVTGANTFTLRGATGTLTCDRQKKTCKTASGQTISY